MRRRKDPTECEKNQIIKKIDKAKSADEEAKKIGRHIKIIRKYLQNSE